MSNFADDPMIVKIRGLLKKAASAAEQGTPEGDNEADAYNEMAAKLIAKYGIDQALLAERGEVKDPIVNKLIKIADGYALDRRSLLFAIVRGLGAQAVYIKRRRPGTQQSYSYTMHVFAYQSDLNRIELLFELLQPQMLLGAAAAQVPWYENARSYRKSWMSGFAMAITARLKRTEKEAAADAGTGTDLVLYDRSKAVKQSYTEAYPKTHSTQRYLNGSGQSQGYAAGQRANLDNRIGGSRPALVGR